VSDSDDDNEEEGHVHTLLLEQDASNRRVTTYMLELGIVTHSVIIGVALGVARGGEFRGLLVALSCHQFFEGIALSTTVLDAGFKSALQPVLVVVFYSLTTPVGIAIGILLSNGYNPNSTSALLVQGIFDAVSAGILIYDGLVNMLTSNVTKSIEFAKRGLCAKASIYTAVWLGAATMAVIGRWA
jgi:zinc transporter 1/2/3